MSTVRTTERELRTDAAGILLALHVMADSKGSEQQQLLEMMLEMLCRIESQVQERLETIKERKRVKSTLG